MARKVKCKLCGRVSEKECMVYEETGNTKKVKHYYCEECLTSKQDRDEALSLFYEYTGSLAIQSQVFLAFKKMRDKGLTNTDILYTMNYIIKNNMNLRFPMGMLYYIDRAMKDKKEVEKIAYDSNRVVDTSIKFMPLYMKEKKKVKDEKDISDFL